MVFDVVWSKTGKGVFQLKQGSSVLHEEHYRVLRMVDGKRTVRELTMNATFPEMTLRGILQTLEKDGFIRCASQVCL